MNYDKLGEMQLDALREIGNIGTGNAATALSKLMNKEVDMEVPKVNIVKLNDIINNISSENVVVAVIIRCIGDMEGNILFILDQDVAYFLIQNLMGIDVSEIDEMGASLLKEVVNIIGGSFLNAISDFTNLKIEATVPAITVDMLSSILSTIFIESEQYDDVLDINTIFKFNKEKIKGDYYFIPKPGSLEILLKSIGII